MLKLLVRYFFLCCTVIAHEDITNATNARLFPSTSECGLSTENRIVGGSVTMLNEFPWTALLQRSNSDFTCGGSLINKRYVLTAAHCMDVAPIVSVRLGEYNLNSTKDCERAFSEEITPSCADDPIDVPVESIIVHEDYNNRRTVDTHDIALLRLSKDVNYTKYIKPICIPLTKLNVTESASQTNLTATVVGWGQTETAYHSDFKLKVQVPIQPTAKCLLSDSGNQLCVGGEEGKDSCAGDSGGPLMVHESNDIQSNWYIIGIVSYGGEKCAVKGIPSIYTHVTNYVEWINNHMKL